MSIEFIETPIENLLICNSNLHKDERGTFRKLYSSKLKEKNLVFGNIVDINVSHNSYSGTVRGLHYQIGQFTETKIVSCVKGAIYDVAVDLRNSSSTKFSYFGLNLTEESNSSLIIPPGFAHGFQTLTDDTIVHYLVDNEYSLENQRGINPLEPKINIPWPLKVSRISRQDLNWPALD